MHNRTMHQGFTLIELMTVVVMIAIMMALAIPSYQQYVARSARSQAQQEMLLQAQQLEQYKARNLSFKGYKASSTAPTGQIYLPKGSAVTDYRYVIEIRDATDRTKDLVSGAGTGWVMYAVPSQSSSAALMASDSMMLTSTGMRCRNRMLINISTTPANCGSGAEPWNQ